MRLITPVMGLALLFFAGTPQRKSALSPTPCSSYPGPSLAVFQALVREYHPQVLRTEEGEEANVVGFLLNTRCRVLHHGTGQRPSRSSSIGDMLASVFPDLQLRDQPYITAGVGNANPKGTVAGGPIVVWAIIE